MTTVTLYGYATSTIVDDFHVNIVETLQSYSSTQFVMQNQAGIFSDQLVFLGNFTTNSGGVSGGTITELKVENASGGLEADITGISVPIANGSFNTGAFLAPGTTYIDKSGSSLMEGEGDDTYVTANNSTIVPGGGLNDINASAGSGVRVLFTGSYSQYTLETESNGIVVVIDSTPTRNGDDIITGTATLKFEGDQTVVQDTDGVLSMTTTAAGAAGSPLGMLLAISDSAANVAANLDSLEALYAAGRITGISLTDTGTTVLSITGAQLAEDSGVLQSITSFYDLEVTGLTAAAAIKLNASGSIAELYVSDSAANVTASLDGLQKVTEQGLLGGISLTDGGVPVLSVTPEQTVADRNGLLNITGNFALSVAAGTSSETINGVGNHSMTVVFSGPASQYTISTVGGGVTVTDGAVVDQISNATALQFSDVTDIVASQTPGVAGGISSYQVATLYSAVLARAPDPAGLAFYENYAANNPTVPFTTYAQWFLQSPEYTASHNYAQTTAGDSQFITDTYNNLLHRAPEAGAVSYYMTNVVEPMLQNVTPGTAAYTAAELAAHAQVLAYVSQSPEFLTNVQVTAQNPSSAQHWLILT